MNSRQETRFFNVSAWLLVITALAKLYSASGSARVFQVQDQLLHIGYRRLMISVALLEIVMAVFLLKSRSNLRRCVAVLWLSGNFLFYHLGNYILGVHLCPCLGRLTDSLKTHLSRDHETKGSQPGLACDWRWFAHGA